MNKTIHNKGTASIFLKKYFGRFLIALHSRAPSIFLFFMFFLFSFWLMFHTFSFDQSTHTIHIAYKLWSDFGAHIPLIRSFSYGDNFPNPFTHQYVQYPIYPGEPIRYHFIFFMIVGVLEKIGLPIDWALNIPSILGFFALLVGIYWIAYELFHSKGASVLSVVFFLFNGSLGFVRFFSLHPLSTNTFNDIFRAKDFPAFAPWGPGYVTAFWNLNIYTNQRHLALAFALICFFILTAINNEKKSLHHQFLLAIPWSIALGLLPFFHQPALVIIAVIMICYFFLFPGRRWFLFFTGIFSLLLILPQLLFDKTGASSVAWYPGYTIHNEIAALPLLERFHQMGIYWWQNLGVHSIFILLGIFFIPPKARKTLLPIIPLFLIPNLFKFSVEASANHKFFNFVMILGTMISAYVIVNSIRSFQRRFHQWFICIFAYLFICILLIVMTLSGIIDFFVVLNDTQGSLTDIPADKTATWIATNTPKRAIFLNSSYLYHPASLAGRPIFLGWPYFAWSAGYPINRMPLMDQMYNERNPQALCRELRKYSISYMTVEQVLNDKNLPNIDLAYYLRTYTPSYISGNRSYAIISTQTICSHR